MRVGNKDLTNGTPISMGTSFNLEPIWLGHIINFSIQLVFTGTPTGTFKLQMSNDTGRDNLSREVDPNSIVNWTDIDDSSQPILAAGNHAWNYRNAGFQWVRVVWTQSASTGSLNNAHFNVKGF